MFETTGFTNNDSFQLFLTEFTPFVISFIDSLEMNDESVFVIEPLSTDQGVIRQVDIVISWLECRLKQIQISFHHQGIQNQRS